MAITEDDGATDAAEKPSIYETDRTLSVAHEHAKTSAAIEVLNGSSANGLATQAAETLRSHQMTVVNVASAGRTQPVTTVEVRPGLTRASVLAASLFDRFSSRGAAEFGDRILSAMRKEFGGHDEKQG